MLTVFIAVGSVLLAILLYFMRKEKKHNPQLAWPLLAPRLKLQYQENPPRMVGKWNGRNVAVDVYHDSTVRIATMLAKPSRLRIEIASIAKIQERAGAVISDALASGDSVFDSKYLARCSDRNAGPKILDEVLRKMLMNVPHVDVIGQAGMVQWVIPEAKDVDTMETILDVLTMIAVEMERYS